MPHSSSSTHSPADAPDDGLVITDVGRAARLIRAGGLVAVPTETVYGLAADASQPDAVRRIFEVKGRPVDHPLIVHIAGLDALAGWFATGPDGELDPRIVTLAATCWPGPLTMIAARGPSALDVVTGGRATVGVRSPSHPLTQALLAELGTGLAAPSANRFGRVSPTTAAHVLADIGDRLVPGRDAILDGGPCAVGVESTIVDLSTDPPQILRAGAITAEDVGRLLAARVAPPSGPSRASGMLEVHYAPSCDVVLADDARSALVARDRLATSGSRVRVLDRTGDLVDAARRLYDDLRAADREGLDALVVVLPPDEGLGVALRDRLTKAAAGSGRGRPSRDG